MLNPTMQLLAQRDEELEEIKKRILALEDARTSRTVAEVAKRVGIAPSTLYKWIDNGTVQITRTPGNGVRFSKTQLLLLMAVMGIEE